MSISEVMDPIDTGTDELLATLDEGVALVTLNRPESRNALSDTLSPALRRLFARLAEWEEARCVVITGKGTAFCAGGDVKGMGGRQTPRKDRPTTREGMIADLTERQQALTGALYALPQPTIAALPGPAAGAGFSIALACDLRIATHSAFLTTGFARVGLSGDYGASFFLPRLVGPAKAHELFFTGERIDSETALSLGLLNRVVEEDQLMETTLEWARRLAAGPTVAYRLMKANLRRGQTEDLPTCLAHEAEGIVDSAQTEDHREAVRAFVEKRAPDFRGR